jgi:hypothetical protein
VGQHCITTFYIVSGTTMLPFSFRITPIARANTAGACNSESLLATVGFFAGWFNLGTSTVSASFYILASATMLQYCSHRLSNCCSFIQQ